MPRWSPILCLIGAACARGEWPERQGKVTEPATSWQPRSYVAPFTDSALTIDGLPNERPWELAPWTADFVDIRGKEDAPPRFRTRAKMLWDTSFLYVAAELQEPDLWATITERDAIIYRDDDFEIFIDPDGDTHNYYELEINALGTVWDLFLVKPYRDGGPALDNWDIEGLQSAVYLNGTINDPSDRDVGWSVEVAIPWESLAEAAGTTTPPADGDRWRVNFSRVEWPLEVRDGVYIKTAGSQSAEAHLEDNWAWSPQGLVNMHYPEMWGFVEFTTATSHLTPRQAAPRPAERAAWLLRRVYYREREWHHRHGWYTDNVGALGLETPAPPGHPWPPTMFVTPSGFEALLRATDGTLVRISADGRVR